jgi:hypothetical protein
MLLLDYTLRSREMKLMELMVEVDKLAERHSKDPAGQKALKSDLLELVQKAIDLGEGKDQNKITGIATGVLKSIFGKKD